MLTKKGFRFQVLRMFRASSPGRGLVVRSKGQGAGSKRIVIHLCSPFPPSLGYYIFFFFSFFSQFKSLAPCPLLLAPRNLRKRSFRKLN